MEDARARRARGSPFRSRLTQTPLPLRQGPLTNTASCWYCDLKIFSLNERVFCFGRRHASFLRSWFSVGIGFTLSCLLVVSMILVWEALQLYTGNARFRNTFGALLFGFSPPASHFAVSLADAGYLLVSSLLALCVHELGHALAAASEGVRMEYIAIFVAVLFPGALVAFNYESLEALPHGASLRVYCAGIWHNAVCCAACILALVFLPFILSPLYFHGESPMVLEVPSSSPLSGFLYTGDIIVSLDGIPLHDVRDWAAITAKIHQQTDKKVNHSDGFNGSKGYCIPRSMIKESNEIQFVERQAICPHDGTAAFACLDSSMAVDGNPKPAVQSWQCLHPSAIVKLNKCGDGWMGGSCQCSTVELCCSASVPAGLTWVEISYSRPYSSECLGSHGSGDACVGRFIFVGDLLSMAHSAGLISYRPRWGLSLGAFLPNVAEKILMSTFYVSLTMALFNSLPMYFLDGESILEAIIGCLNLRGMALKACLFAGTLLSLMFFCRLFLNFP